MHFGEVPADFESFKDRLAEAMLREKIIRYRIRDGLLMALAATFKKR